MVGIRLLFNTSCMQQTPDSFHIRFRTRYFRWIHQWRVVCGSELKRKGSLRLQMRTQMGIRPVKTLFHDTDRYFVPTQSVSVTTDVGSCCVFHYSIGEIYILYDNSCQLLPERSKHKWILIADHYIDAKTCVTSWSLCVTTGLGKEWGKDPHLEHLFYF